MNQLTKEQAIEFYERGEWRSYTDRQIVDLQLYQEYLCVPFDRFHEAMEKVLDRPVWTHEFGNFHRLTDEYEGRRPKATISESFQALVDLWDETHPEGNAPIIVVAPKSEAK